MRILLYSPDNGVSQNFMPHLWMFLLQAITPKGHEVLLIDGNAEPMSDAKLVRFALDNKIGLVGIGAMTRMIAKAYRVADAFRAAGIPVVMGGPHVTELPQEALGQTGGPRHVDAVAVGEADATWPTIVEDAARGELREVYKTGDGASQESKPSLRDYPKIPWDSVDLTQFNRIPSFAAPIMKHYKTGWETFHIIPVESGRGCPYACEFCTVTGFFGDSIRFRTNQSIVEEMLHLKALSDRTRGKIAVFFVDDNLAINLKRTKSLLRDIIQANAQLAWVGQISANLLRDEELVDLIAESGGKWIFIGMESIDRSNLASVNKSFNQPGEYRAVLERLAQRNVYAITSFIFGLDNDTPGVAARTLEEIGKWPAGLPVFGQITPYPGTTLYSRLAAEDRLARPKHWLEFSPFQMAHTPMRMTVPEVHQELAEAWASSYGPEGTERALRSLKHEPLPYKVSHLIARLFFRGIYFRQKGVLGWLRVLFANRRSIGLLIEDSLRLRRGETGREEPLVFETGRVKAPLGGTIHAESGSD